MTTEPIETADRDMMTTRLVEEVFNALGMSKTGFACRNFGWVLKPIAGHLTDLLVPFDRDIAEGGTQVATRKFITHFVDEVKSRGVDYIPTTGPIIVASNHPGAYDSIAIISQIPRPDTKVIISDIPVFKYMPYAKQCVFYATSDPATRTNALREAIRHLESGGCFVIFSTGLIDPDPDVWGEQEAIKHIEGWSSSLELLLRKVPEARLVVTIASGVLDPGWAESRLTHIVKPGIDRRRLAEFGQVISQLLRPGHKKYTPHISFSPPVMLDDLGRGKGEAMPKIKARARELLAEHMAYKW